ncbi:hypothetical protein Tco_0589316 [Tanacetum coccineum]
MMNTSKDSTEQANKDEVKEVKVEYVDYRSPARYNDEENPVKEKVEVTHLINPKVFKRGCHRGRYGQTTTPWKVVQDVNHKKYSNGDVIVADDDHDHDVRHVTRFDLLLVPSCFVIFTFEPLTLSLTFMPSCDLEYLTNILILCLILKASDQSLRKSLSLNLELS